VKIRIVKQTPQSVEGYPLHHYHVGFVYDVAPSLANVLVADGYAIFEMRDEHSTLQPDVDRRKKR